VITENVFTSPNDLEHFGLKFEGKTSWHLKYRNYNQSINQSINQFIYLIDSFI